MRKIFAAAAACLALLGCKGETPRTGRETVRIGIVYPLTGDGAKFGEAAKAAAEIFFEEFNKNEGRKFDYELVWEDNQGKPAVSYSAAQRLIGLQKVDALLGYASNLMAPVSPLAEKAKVIKIAVGSDPRLWEGAYNFGLGNDLAEANRKIIGALKDRGAKTVATVALESSGQITVLDAFRKAVQEDGALKISGEFSVNPGERDFRTLLQKIKQLKPDYIYAQMMTPEIDVFLKQRREQNVSIPVTGAFIFTYMQHPALAEGLWYADAGNAPSFLEAYEKKTGRAETDHGECMHAMLRILTAAYESAPEKDNEKAAAFIAALKDLPTAAGALSSDGEGLIVLPSFLKRIAGGKAVPLDDNLLPKELQP